MPRPRGAAHRGRAWTATRSPRRTPAAGAAGARAALRPSGAGSARPALAPPVRRAVRIRAGVAGRLASPRRPRAAAEEVPGAGDGGDRASGAAAALRVRDAPGAGCGNG